MKKDEAAHALDTTDKCSGCGVYFIDNMDALNDSFSKCRKLGIVVLAVELALADNTTDKFVTLQAVVMEGSADEAAQLCKKLSAALNERNHFCKLHKKQEEKVHRFDPLLGGENDLVGLSKMSNFHQIFGCFSR